jgi:hypothetical protein
MIATLDATPSLDNLKSKIKNLKSAWPRQETRCPLSERVFAARWLPKNLFLAIVIINFHYELLSILH